MQNIRTYENKSQLIPFKFLLAYTYYLIESLYYTPFCFDFQSVFLKEAFYRHVLR